MKNLSKEKKKIKLKLKKYKKFQNYQFEKLTKILL